MSQASDKSSSYDKPSRKSTTGQALYRKYRARKFSDVIGQEHITKTLQNAIKTGKISHAYLFTGPRGVGKTSVARILAHEVNQLPYDDEAIHLDIIEIDAASNRRIDEIREIRERVHIAPTSARYKVYIVDEVHMLTREAFNALLKTLEEPPAHCIFILATTEAHKLPETIISRTQRFEFKPIGTIGAAKQLGNIAKQERIDITSEALDLLANYGEGSFRDSISLLDQLSAMGQTITEELIRDFMGLPSADSVAALLSAVENNNGGGVIKQLDSMIEHGSNPTSIAETLMQQLRNKVIGGADKRYVKLMKDLLMVAGSPQPQQYLELCLLDAIDGEPTNKGNDDKPGNSDKSEPPKETKKPAEPKPEKKTAAAAGNFDLAIWPKVLGTVKTEAASLYTALKLAKPSMDEGKLVLAFEFPLHQKKINQAKNKGLISKIIEEQSGGAVNIECVVDKELFKPAPELTQSTFSVASAGEEDPEKLKTINNIFGASEVLES